MCRDRMQMLRYRRLRNHLALTSICKLLHFAVLRLLPIRCIGEVQGRSYPPEALDGRKATFPVNRLKLPRYIH